MWGAVSYIHLCEGDNEFGKKCVGTDFAKWFLMLLFDKIS